jgi:hypothetical protein
VFEQNVYSSIGHNSQEMETTQVTIDRKTDKQNVGCAVIKRNEASSVCGEAHLCHSGRQGTSECAIKIHTYRFRVIQGVGTGDPISTLVSQLSCKWIGCFLLPTGWAQCSQGWGSTWEKKWLKHMLGVRFPEIRHTKYIKTCVKGFPPLIFAAASSNGFCEWVNSIRHESVIDT